MRHYAVIAACALLVSLPLLLYGPSCGHDFDFHLQSWFAVRSAWRLHLFDPHWVPGANYGAGEPRLVFYPPLSWVLGGLLGTVVPWTWVPQAFTWLALFCCGSAFYALARRWVEAGVAAGAACLYLAGPYLLFVAYERAAYGELLGATAMPLAVLYALRPRPAVIRLAVVVASLWLTNAPAAVMGCYLVVLCAGASGVAARGALPAVRGAFALALGTGLAGVYVMPAWYEQRWVEIARVVGPGMRVQDSYLFGHTGEPFHDQVLHTASLIGVGVLAAGLLWVAVSWVAWRVKGRGSGPGGLLLAVVGVGLVAILVLLLPVSGLVWRFGPELHFLQFPWRWLLVASMLAALAAAAAAQALGLGALASRQRVLAWIAVSALCVGAWGAGRYAQHGFSQVCDEEDNVRAQEMLLAPAASNARLPAGDAPASFEGVGPASFEGVGPAGFEGEAPAGFEGTDEYTPLGADNGEVQQGLPAVRLLPGPEDDEGDDSAAPNPVWRPTGPEDGIVRVLAWAPEHKRLTVTASAPRYAVLRLMDYPAWQVECNGRAVTERPHREDGLLTLSLPAGTTTVDVRYRTTADVKAGRLISLLSLGALAVCTGWTRRHRARMAP